MPTPFVAGRASPPRRRRRHTLRVRCADGMVYRMVFDGSLHRLRVAALKRHLHSASGIPAGGGGADDRRIAID
eukprot:gene3406-15103_t